MPMGVADGDTVDFASPLKSELVEAVGLSGRPQPERFRSGRWFLLIEGVLVAGLAGITIAGWGMHSAQGIAGFMLWGLMMNPLRSALLYAFGVAAVISSLNRHAATVLTTTSMAIFLALTAIGDVAAHTGVARQWGIDPHNAALYAALALYNFALLMWLIPDLRLTRTGASPDGRTEHVVGKHDSGSVPPQRMRATTWHAPSKLNASIDDDRILQR